MRELAVTTGAGWMEKPLADGDEAPRPVGWRLERQWLYALAGLVLALGAPAGLLGMRWLQGGDAFTGWPMRAVASDRALFAYVTFSTAAVFSLFGFVLGRQADHLVRLLQVDSLTGLLNRRAFLERLVQERSRTLRYAQPLGVLLLDVDSLKTVNDQGGHAAGDAALRSIGTAIRIGLRATDVGCRYGGDEFAVMAPQADEPAALTLAERIRTLSEAARLPSGLRTTVSVGVACVAAGEPWEVASVLERADRALYEAKRTGRNRVVLEKEVAS